MRGGVGRCNGGRVWKTEAGWGPEAGGQVVPRAGRGDAADVS